MVAGGAPGARVHRGPVQLGVPVVAMLLAWALLSERPGGAELAGMALILAGIWVVSRAAPPGRQ